MPHPVFPLDHLYPLARVGAFVESGTNLIRDTWTSFNNDASQVFEKGTTILTKAAPKILDLMVTTPSMIAPTTSSVVTPRSASDQPVWTVTPSGCKKWCDLQLNGCEVELEWYANLSGVLFVLVLALILIIVFYYYCGRRKTVDEQIQTVPALEVSTKTVAEADIENLRRQLAQQEEKCDEEKAEFQRKLSHADKENKILVLEVLAANPAATAKDKDKLIDAQRLQLQGEHALLEQEQGRLLELRDENAEFKQHQANIMQQVREIQRDAAEQRQRAEKFKSDAMRATNELADLKKQRLSGVQECEKEKQLLRVEAERAYKELELAQHDILALLGQTNVSEEVPPQPDEKSQTETTAKIQGRQTLIDKQTQTTASVDVPTGISAGRSTSPLSLPAGPSLSDNSRVPQLERENANLQRQCDSARADVARIRRAHEEHGKYQKTLEDLLESSKIVEQNVKEINERCLHDYIFSERKAGMSPMSSRHTSEQGEENVDAAFSDLLQNEDGNEELTCASTRCHKCPWYAGESHHICPKNEDDVLNADIKLLSNPEFEEEKVETPVPSIIIPSTRIPKPKPAPLVPFPESLFRINIPPPPAESGGPSIGPVDCPNPQSSGVNPSPPPPPPPPTTRRPRSDSYLARQCFKEIRQSFSQSYKVFQEKATRTTCSGSRHAKKLEGAADDRYDSFREIGGQIWRPGFDLDSFRKKCDGALRTWTEEHDQNRKHLAKNCSKDDAEMSTECLSADDERKSEQVSDSDHDPESGFDDFDGDQPESESKRANPKEPRNDDLDSLFGDSGDEERDSGSPMTKADTEEERDFEDVLPEHENASHIGLVKKPAFPQTKPKEGPQAAVDAIEPATPESETESCGDLVIIDPGKEDLKQPRTPEKTLPESLGSGSAVSDISSTVPPTPPTGAGAGMSDQPASEKLTGEDLIIEKHIQPLAAASLAPLAPPNLPLPSQESQLDAILMYEAERGHEFTQLSTSGDGFLCGVNAVELTTAHMHPEIGELTAAALLEVLEWQEYRDIVDDSRFTYRNDLGQLIAPTNRTFFSVDQLASMVGLWGSRRGLDLRLGVNREDYGPSVYGGPRNGRTVILWIHHDNNEERSQHTEFPAVDHFSGYKRVPADTIDEAKAKEVEVDEQAKGLRETERTSKVKTDAKEQSKEQFKEVAKTRKTQSLREAKEKNATSVPSVSEGFKPPKPPMVVKKPMIDFRTFNPSSINFNIRRSLDGIQPANAKPYRVKDLGIEVPDERERKEKEAREQKEAAEKVAADKARQETENQALENASLAINRQSAKQAELEKVREGARRPSELLRSQQEAAAQPEGIQKQQESEQLSRQIKEREQQGRTAQGGVTTKEDLDHEMVQAPSPGSEHEKMAEDSDSSDLSEMPDNEVNALVGSDFVDGMDVDEPSEAHPKLAKMTPYTTPRPEPFQSDWKRLSDADAQRKLREAQNMPQAQSPHYPGPSKPWHFALPLGMDQNPSIVPIGSTLTPTGNPIPQLTMQSPIFVPRKSQLTSGLQPESVTDNKVENLQPGSLLRGNSALPQTSRKLSKDFTHDEAECESDSEEFDSDDSDLDKMQWVDPKE